MNVIRFSRILRPLLRINSSSICGCQAKAVKNLSSLVDHPNKTTVDIINDTANRDVTQMPPFVTQFTPGGFVINGMQILGPIGILTRHILCWKVSSLDELTPEAFHAFTILEPPVDIIVIGTGDRLTRLKPEVHQFMKKQGILLEVQDTPHACATFNFLLEERRQVAAALLPVSEIEVFKDEDE